MSEDKQLTFSDLMDMLLRAIIDTDLNATETKKTNESMVLRMQEMFKDFISVIPAEAMNSGDFYSKMLLKLKECGSGIPNFMEAFRKVDRSVFIPYFGSEFHEKEYKAEGKGLKKEIEGGFFEINPNNEKELRVNPYHNLAIPIGFNATCSAPHIISLYNMIADFVPEAKIFEAGTGCGYHAAVTASINPKFRVYSADITREFQKISRENIGKLPEGRELLERIVIGEADCAAPDNKFMLKNAPYDLIYFTFMLCEDLKVIKSAISCLKEDGIVVVPWSNSRKNPRFGNLIALSNREEGQYNLGNVGFMPAIRKSK